MGQISKIPISEIVDNKELEGLVADAISYSTSASAQSEALVKGILDLIASEIKEK